MLIFLSGLNALCGVMQLTLRYRSNFTYCRIIGELIYLCFIGFVLTAKAFSAADSDAVELKTALYDKCVKKTAELMENILSRSDKAAVCKTAADGVAELYREIFAEGGEDSVSFSVSVEENGAYRQIYSDLSGSIN